MKRLVDDPKKMDSIEMCKTHQIMKLNLCLLSFIDVFVSTFITRCFSFYRKWNKPRKDAEAKKKWAERKNLSERQRDWMDSRLNKFYKSQAAFFASSSTIHHQAAILLYLFYFARFLRSELFLCLHFPSFLPLVPIFLTLYAYGSSSTPFLGKKNVELLIYKHCHSRFDIRAICLTES